MVKKRSKPKLVELEHLFDLSSDMLGGVGFDGYFRHVNPAVKQVLGYTQEEFAARWVLDLVHPDDRPATAAEIERLAGGEATVSFENRHLCKDGSYK